VLDVFRYLSELLKTPFGLSFLPAGMHAEILESSSTIALNELCKNVFGAWHAVLAEDGNEAVEEEFGTLSHADVQVQIIALVRLFGLVGSSH